MAIHSVFLLVAQEPKSYAMPAGTDSPTVSIKFVPGPSKPVQPTVQPKPAPPDPVKTTSKPEKVIEKSKPKPIKKSSEVKKVLKKQSQQTQPKPQEKTAKETSEKVTKPQKQNTEEKTGSAQSTGVTANPVLVEKPTFLTKPSPPKYPRIAQKRGIEGVALYEIWLDEEGKQVKQVLISSSGATMLDKSALDAIKKWKFSPHSVGGRTIAHRVKIPVRFKLD